MKKILLTSIIIVITLGISTTFIKNYEVTQTKKKNEVEKVLSYLNEMSIEEKIGQMLMISDRTAMMSENLQNNLTENKPGGFIFFSENFTNKEESLKLIDAIKQSSKIPLLLSIDQEGGRVQRLKTQNDIQVFEIPSMIEVGKNNDVNYAFEIGKKIGKDLNAYSLNMNFAPVLDTLTNSSNKSLLDRSFGSDYNLVSNMGISVAKGLKEEKIIPVYKHFPGLGSTIVDSHYDLPVLSKTKEELLKSDLIPFQAAIQNNAEIIMIGHLSIPSITKDQTPSSLSKEIITNLLKEEMGFTGIVITDALNMKALTKYYKESEIYEMAINAGVDILLMPENPSFAITSIKDSIKKGNIQEEKINESVKKILLLKAKYLGFLKDIET